MKIISLINSVSGGSSGETPDLIRQAVKKAGIHDADLTIVDMDLISKVRNEDLLTKCGWSPFNGMELKGWPVMTIVNGNIIFENGRINDIKAKEVIFAR